LLEKYHEDVNLVIKHYPLPMHEAAMPAARAALAAEKQGKYREMSAILFKNYRALTPKAIRQYAEQIDLDMTVYEMDVQSPQIRKIIAQDMQDARWFRVRGVPTFYINGILVKNRSFEGFEQIIKEEL
jgi:protein-disulfide isomerase